MVTPNFASSGTLQKQIEQGAPADVFISAAAGQMDALQKQDLLLDDTRKDLLNNRVVLVVPGDSTIGLASFKDLTADRVKKIALGDPKSVPAGTYGQQAFDELGISAQIQSKLVLASDVRQVLSYVESGSVDAGVVYSTDALDFCQGQGSSQCPGQHQCQSRLSGGRHQDEQEYQRRPGLRHFSVQQ